MAITTKGTTTAITFLMVNRSSKAANCTTKTCQSRSPNADGLSRVHFFQSALQTAFLPMAFYLHFVIRPMRPEGWHFPIGTSRLCAKIDLARQELPSGDRKAQASHDRTERTTKTRPTRRTEARAAALLLRAVLGRSHGSDARVRNRLHDLLLQSEHTSAERVS